MAYVIWLKEVGLDNDDVVGEKAALLGEVFGVAPVPLGFVLKTNAFQMFISNQRSKIHSILAESIDDEQKAEKINLIISSIEFPADLKKEIVEAYEKIGLDYKNVQSAYDLVKIKQSIPVVVRCNLFSEKDESVMETAFEVNVIGGGDLIGAIKQCWADFFVEEVIEFLTSEDIDFDDIKVTAIIQKMVYAHKAGIIYTVHPDTGEEDKIAIEACWGMDDYFMLDENETDMYVIDKDSLEIKERDVKTQEYAYLLDKKTGEPMRKSIPQNEQGIKALKDEEIKQLASIAKKIEDKVGEDLEIEFIIEKYKAYITQVNFVEEEGDEDYEEGQEYEEVYDDEPDLEEVEDEDSEETEEYLEEVPEEVEDTTNEDYFEEGESPDNGDFEQELRDLMSRYMAINPELKNAFELLEKDIIRLYKRLRE